MQPAVCERQILVLGGNEGRERQLRSLHLPGVICAVAPSLPRANRRLSRRQLLVSPLQEVDRWLLLRLSTPAAVAIAVSTLETPRPVAVVRPPQMQ